MSDVLGELLRLSRCPDQVPSPRVQLLMVAAKDRLTSMDTLLMLLPLTAVPSYMWWLRRASSSVAMRSMKAQRRRGCAAVDASGEPLNHSLVSAFKAYLVANPGQLGPYVLLGNSLCLEAEVYSDISCLPALAALPKALLTEVCTRHGGVLSLNLYSVACVACRTARMLPTDCNSGQALASFMFAIDWLGILRVCCLTMDPACGGSEALFLEALCSMSLCSSPPCCTMTPGLLQQMTGPCKAVLPLLRRLFKRFLKGVAARTATYVPTDFQAGRSFVAMLSTCKNFEVMPAAWRRGLSEDYSFSDEAIRGFQSDAHEGMEALRSSNVWGVLEKLQEELTHASADLTLAFGLVGLGSALGVEPPLDSDDFIAKVTASMQADSSVDNRVANDEKRQLAYTKGRDRLFLQVR